MRMPCSKPLAAALVATLALATVGTAHAQWVWRDKTGRVNASDLPPPRDIADKDILQRPPGARTPAPALAPADPATAGTPPAPPTPTPKPAVDKDLEAKRRAAEQQQQAAKKAEEEKLAQQRADNCKRARTAAATMESGQRVARTAENGEREILDDAARADELRRARDVIASDCR